MLLKIVLNRQSCHQLQRRVLTNFTRKAIAVVVENPVKELSANESAKKNIQQTKTAKAAYTAIKSNPIKKAIAPKDIVKTEKLVEPPQVLDQIEKSERLEFFEIKKLKSHTFAIEETSLNLQNRIKAN